MKIKLLSFLLFFSSVVLFAQNENTLFLMDNVYQSGYSNPVAIPQNKISIGFPGISSIHGYFNMDHLTVNNVSYDSAGTRVIDEDLWGNNPNLTDENYIDVGFIQEYFHLRLRIKKMWWSFHVADRLNQQTRYPKEFAQLVADGNAQFEGETVDISSLAINGIHYREFALGVLREGEKFNFGGKAKLLFGMGNVTSDIDEISYTIEKGEVGGEPGYKHVAFINGTVYTSGVDTVENKSDEDRIIDYLTNQRNLGFALDFGATYKLDDRWEFTGAVTDLGFIKWKSNIVNYNFSGDTSYVGYDPALEYIEQDESGIESDFDSIGEKFIYEESHESYTTMLKYKAFLTAKYRFGRSTYATGMLNIHNYRGFRPTGSLGIYHEIKRVLNIGVTNTFMNHQFFNLGLGVSANLGPVQLYFVTDKLDAIFDLYDTSHITFRFGMNLIFGKVLYQESLPVDKD